MGKQTVIGEEKRLSDRLREFAEHLAGSALADEGRALIHEAAAALDNVKPPRFAVSYTYNSPSSAGPFKGRAEVNRRYASGEHIRAPFGVATVRTCREVRS